MPREAPVTSAQSVCRAVGAHHSITPAPQVKPAAKAPTQHARAGPQAAVALGLGERDAGRSTAEVLPWRSMQSTTRSVGRPRPLAHRARDAGVGLVEDEQVDVVEPHAGGRACLERALAQPRRPRRGRCPGRCMRMARSSCSMRMQSAPRPSEPAARARSVPRRRRRSAPRRRRRRTGRRWRGRRGRVTRLISSAPISRTVSARPDSIWPAARARPATKPVQARRGRSRRRRWRRRGGHRGAASGISSSLGERGDEDQVDVGGVDAGARERARRRPRRPARTGVSPGLGGAALAHAGAATIQSSSTPRRAAIGALATTCSGSAVASDAIPAGSGTCGLERPPARPSPRRAGSGGRAR